MTYFEKLLETHPIKEAARIAFDGCPGEHFEDAKTLTMFSEGCKAQSEKTCGDCWLAEIQEEQPEEHIAEIRNTMKALGCRKGEHVSLRHISGDRATVYLGDERFGIYDFEKHTFVD